MHVALRFPIDSSSLWTQIIGKVSNLEITEMCARSGANCGSLFLDLRFRELVKVCSHRLGRIVGVLTTTI